MTLASSVSDSRGMTMWGSTSRAGNYSASNPDWGTALTVLGIAALVVGAAACIIATVGICAGVVGGVAIAGVAGAAVAETAGTVVVVSGAVAA
jgi:hypothetical protein